MTRFLMLLLLLAARLPADDGLALPEPFLPMAPPSAGLSLGAPSMGLSGDWRSKDYDPLYSLLQQYRDELEGLRAENEKIKREAALLQEAADALARRIDNIRPLDGLKFHGRLQTYADDMLLLGPGAQSPGVRGRFRLMVQRVELSLRYQRGFISALVQQDMQYVFGNQYIGWVSANTGVESVAAPSGFSLGMRGLYIDFDLPLRVRIGDYDEQLTPLTFWRNEDQDPETPAIFAARLQRLRDDRSLKDDHRYHQRGLRLGWGAKQGQPGPGFRLLASQLAHASDAMQGRDNWIYETSANGSPRLFGVYDIFLGGGTLHWGSPGGALNFSAQGTAIGDSGDAPARSNVPRVYGAGGHPDPNRAGKPFDTFLNLVYGAALSVSPSALFRAEAEVAMSSLRAPGVGALWLSQDHGPDGALQGNAMAARINGDLAWLGYEARYTQVGKYYIAGAAQGRTRDTSFDVLGPFEHENSNFDAASQGYGALRMPRAPVAGLNGTMLGPVLWYRDGFGALKSTLATIPYDPALNSIDPYGMGTPNQGRYGGTLRLNLLSGGLRLRGDVDQAMQLESLGDKLATLRYGGGGSARWGSLSVNGYYRIQSVADGVSTALNSAQVQSGVEWAAWKGGALQGGFRHLDYNGVLPYHDLTPFATPDAALLMAGSQAVNRSYDQWSVGLMHEFREDLTLWVNYGVTLMSNPLAGQPLLAVDSRPSFSVEQGYARVTLDF